jgi:hypothetical protein
MDLQTEDGIDARSATISMTTRQGRLSVGRRCLGNAAAMMSGECRLRGDPRDNARRLSQSRITFPMRKRAEVSHEGGRSGALSGGTTETNLVGVPNQLIGPPDQPLSFPECRRGV